MPNASYAQTLEAVRAFADRCRENRLERQHRRHLDPDDFRILAEGGLTLTGVPAAKGGLWHDPWRSAPEYAALYRALAKGDPAVALVACMHPAVLTFWCVVAEAPPPYTADWASQCDRLYGHAKDGLWFGTIASEPGSGGDLLATRTRAEPDGQGGYQLTGDKHMGSGSGITSFMVTTAKAPGDDNPDFFVLDMRERAWDGSTGLKQVRAWDGLGMKATQSHAFRLQDIPSERYAWTGEVINQAGIALLSTQCCFMAVSMGILDSVQEEARRRLQPKAATGRLSAFEEVEWTKAVNEIWLANQAFDGVLRAVANQDSPVRSVAEGKTAISTLGEQALTRISRVIGGASYAESQPFGQWFQDFRALGFLRPPWALAFQTQFLQSWSDDDEPLVVALESPPA